jgi:hypothetical protein
VDHWLPGCTNWRQMRTDEPSLPVIWETRGNELAAKTADPRHPTIARIGILDRGRDPDLYERTGIQDPFLLDASFRARISAK